MTHGNGKKRDNFGRVKQIVQLYVSIGFSLLVMGASLFLILSKQYNDEYTKWAFSMVGLILGYWLSSGIGKK
jgi:hypothetical protein